MCERAAASPSPPPAPPASGRGATAAGGEGVTAAIAHAAARFGFSATPRLDAELLMAHALGIDRAALLLDSDRDTPASFATLVARRARHEPVAYITGTRGFWTIDLAVAPGVLVPRADSETLIEAAVSYFATRAPRTILDLGTGSGALLLAALDQWPQATGVGIDRSPVALAVACGNAQRLGMQGRARIVAGGWGGDGAAYDLILCNPPYIANGETLPEEVACHEPASALFAGADGLDDYRAIAPGLRAQLTPGGAAVLEIGAAQAAAVAALLHAARFATALHHDLGGRPRAILATPV